MDPKEFGLYINNLWAVFTVLNSKEDIRLLFKDLFTHTEYKMFAKRLEISHRLLSGQSYEQIQQEVKVTPSTVAKINNILMEKGDGLRKAYESLERLAGAKLKKQREIIKSFENPVLNKTKRKTVAGVLLKAGIAALDKKLLKKYSENSAKKMLDQ